MDNIPCWAIHGLLAMEEVDPQGTLFSEIMRSAGFAREHVVRMLGPNSTGALIFRTPAGDTTLEENGFVSGVDVCYREEDEILELIARLMAILAEKRDRKVNKC